MNQNDISQWFEQNNILTELRDLCRFQDGYELMDFAEIFRDTKKLQYQLYYDEFLSHDGITFSLKDHYYYMSLQNFQMLYENCGISMHNINISIDQN